MKLHSLALRTTGQFPALLLDYLDQKIELKEFYSVLPSVEGAFEAIKNRQEFDPEKRKTLVQVLQKQYEGLPSTPDLEPLLDANTFTVTTGHQLNIFTGPLYVIYKIVTTLALARQLKETYPDYNFVPLYWMATEDHDFQEIAYFNLFGKKYSWKGDYTGAVGRLNPAGLVTILDELPEPLSLFKKAYLENDTLANAVRCYMHELFGAEGLVSLDADDPALKRQFLPVIEDELFVQTAGPLVSETTARLASLGYHTPVHPRDINLFYLINHSRERIVQVEDKFQVLNTELIFTPEEIRQEMETYPERFSPNVVLRPLYEEVILPNLAYIGGPSEIPYWMQLKGVFDHFSVPFPMLIPRNFALYVPTASRKRMEKLNLSYLDFFQDRALLKKTMIERLSSHTLSLDEQKNKFDGVLQEIVAKALAVDKTMEPAVLAERARLFNSLEKLEKRIRKAEERKHGIQVNQLDDLLTTFFPNGTPQERHDNFLTFYQSNRQFIQVLLEHFKPLEFQFNILEES
ncbi:bacillithiol biosynthesis cysteine-adding enzyme BshC [Arundinibacter roseus]|uniref:Putative cysteine ligase BshC n=1 Tax=Arundinibacter roseus TaxID=2070510 RepID=A0A4R4JZM7_9BACT|nr:bacillithiol biosynthesis cysteine-adding enzyme BshC [Arundinibacter roseus]TDB60447.1 bacillithiol biosynthesis cysteine-adding enzyme BshC [Arundinibacter roseus]